MEAETIFVSLPKATGSYLFRNAETEPFRFNLHKHEMFSEMLLVERGEGRFEIGGTVYEATEGTLLFYQRGTWHREDSVKHPFHAIYLSFKGLRVEGLEDNHFLGAGTDPVLPLGEHYPEIRSLMKECAEAFASPEPEARTIADQLLGILFAKLARIAHYGSRSDSQSRYPRDAVMLARRHMEEHYRDPITLENLAAIAFVNKYHLAHLFKERLGQSPIQFLIRYRMEVACYYLKETPHSIGLIAEWVGYQSEPSFFHVFRKTVGMTPRQYRESPEAVPLDLS